MAAHDAAGLTPPLPGLTPGAATQGEQMEISNTKQAKKNNYFEFRDAWHLLNTPPSDGPVSLEGDNLTRTPQSGNGDNAPDTVQLVPQVEAAQTSGKSAQEPPSRSAEMR